MRSWGTQNISFCVVLVSSSVFTSSPHKLTPAFDSCTPFFHLPRACQLVSCWKGSPSPRCPFGRSLRVREPGPQGGFPPWQPGRLWPSRLQRGWMRPAPGFTRRPSPPFPPVTKLSRTTVTERTRLGRELNCGTSAASLSESSCLLHESRTNIIVMMDLRSLVESAHDSAGRVSMRERLDLASAPAIRRRARFLSPTPPTPGPITDPQYAPPLPLRAPLQPWAPLPPVHDQRPPSSLMLHS
jgi:hypothetical protein